MQVVILGAGVIGVSTAYYLAKAGCEVTVIERHASAALECSFANGAQLSYSHAEPWANFSNLFKAIKWLGRIDSPLLIRPRLDWQMYSWLLKFIANCPRSRFLANTKQMVALSMYSRHALHELVEAEKLNFNYTKSGILHIFKNSGEITDNLRHLEQCKKFAPNLEFKTLTRNECVNLDPSLELLMRKRKGGILCPLDESGDAYLFTTNLIKVCEKLGVKFHFNVNINQLISNNQKITGVKTDKGIFKAQKYIIALGAYSSKYVATLGIKLPIYPMKGYSISIPLIPGGTAPHISVTDHQKKTVFTTIGTRLRVGGTVEFAGYDTSIPYHRIKPILSLTKRFFPAAGDFKNITTWSCLRPQTPSSNAIIQKTVIKNLYINAGHGSLGWTQAVGSGKLMTKLILQ